LLSMRFSFKNFFAFFIAMTMKMTIFMILIKKRVCFDSKRDLRMSLKIR
jgi:hypothetical protein